MPAAEAVKWLGSFARRTSNWSVENMLNAKTENGIWLNRFALVSFFNFDVFVWFLLIFSVTFIESGCDLFPILKNGMQFYLNNKTQAMFFCHPQYRLIGPTRAICNGKEWNVAQPKCQSMFCSVPKKCIHTLNDNNCDICWDMIDFDTLN